MPEFKYQSQEKGFQTLFHRDGMLEQLKITPDGNYIISCANDIRVWNFNTLELVKTIKPFNEGVASIDISPDGNILVCSEQDYSEEMKDSAIVKVYNIHSGDLIRTIKITGEKTDPISPDVNPNKINYVQFSPDGKYIAGSTWNKIKIWDAETTILTLEVGIPGSPKHISFSHDGKYFMTCTLFGHIFVWEFPSGKVKLQYRAHSVFGPAIFSLDDNYIISGGGFQDKTIRIWEFPSGNLLHTLEGHTTYISELTVSHDNSFFASAGGDGTIKLWNIETGKNFNTIKGKIGALFSVCISPDNKKIIGGGSIERHAEFEGIIKIWDLSLFIKDDLIEEKAGEKIEDIDYSYPIDQNLQEQGLKYAYRLTKSLGHSDTVTSIGLSPDGKLLASGSYDNTVKIWDFFKGELIKTLKGHSAWITSILYSPTGSSIVSSDLDGTIKIWDLKKGACVRDITTYREDQKSIALTLDEKNLISGSSDGSVIIWDFKTGDKIKELSTEDGSHSRHVSSITLSSDNKYCVTGSNDGTIKIWDLQKLSLERTIEGGDFLQSVSLTKDNKHIISAAWDGTIKVWEIETANLLHTIEENNKYVKIAKISPDGKSLLTFSGTEEDTEYNLRKYPTGEILNTYYEETEIYDLIFSLDGKYIISATQSPTINVRNIESGSIVQKFEGNEDNLSAITINIDGKYVLSSIGTNYVDVWQFPSGKQVNRLKGHNNRIFSIRVSKDNHVITASIDGVVKIWKLSNFKLMDSLVLKLGGPFSNIKSVNISDDGTMILAGFEKGDVKVFDVESKKQIKNFLFKKDDTLRIGDFKWVHSVDISSDNRFIAAGSQDGTVKVWDFNTEELLYDFIVYAKGMRITHVQFSPDSRYIAASSIFSIIKIWDLENGNLYADISGGHDDYITTFDFSGDNKFLISGSNDNRVFIRSLSDKESYGPFILSSPVKYVSLIPDTTMLIGADINGEILVWDYLKVVQKKAEADKKERIEEYLNRVENLALLLSDVYNFSLGKEYRVSKENMAAMLRDLIDNEFIYLLIYFTGAYYGIKKQLVNKAQYTDAIEGMRDLMGWEKEPNKKKVRAFNQFAKGMDYLKRGDFENAVEFLKEAHKIDPNNPFICFILSRAFAENKEFGEVTKYRTLGLKLEAKMNEREENPSEEFEILIQKFYEKKNEISSLSKKRSYYNTFLSGKIDPLVIFGDLLNEVGNTLKEKTSIIPFDQISFVMEDILNVVLEWISIISGVAYYILEYELGTQDQINDVLDAIKDAIGMKEHKDLGEIREEGLKRLFQDYDEEKTPSIPGSISVLSSPKQSVLEASRGKIPQNLISSKSSLQDTTLITPEQSKILRELEKIIGRQIPQLTKIDYGTFGFKVENNNIVDLGLISCGLSIVPDCIGGLNSLKKLIIRDNYLSTVPNSIGKLTSLESLSLCGFLNNSKLNSLPESLKSLKKLKNLTLESNRLDALPDWIGKLESLEELNLYGNNLQTLPESIGDLSNLKTLFLSLNRIKQIPDSFGRLQSLKKISLHQNWIDKLPKSFTELGSLEELDLSWNSLKNLPDSFENLTSLKELNLNYNQFKTFPEVISNLKSLEWLDLSSNQLEKLPESIGYITSLKYLNLGYNHDLKLLPESIANLKNLETLGLEELYSIELPESLQYLQQKGMDMYGKEDIEYDESGNFDLRLYIQGWGTPSVIDYEDEVYRSKLMNPDEIIIQNEAIKVEFTYPLSVDVVFEYKNKGGFSRLDLWRCIYNGYKKIYDEEEAAVGDPGNVPGLLNRARSSGPYGIWGHDFSELFLERISYNARTKTVGMFIGS